MMEKEGKWQAIKEAGAERTTSPNNNGGRARERERDGKLGRPSQLLKVQTHYQQSHVTEGLSWSNDTISPKKYCFALF